MEEVPQPSPEAPAQPVDKQLWAGMLRLTPCAWTDGHSETPDSTFL